MIKSIIIDDEPLAITALSKLLERYFSEQVRVVATAKGVTEGVNAIKRHHPDLVFLDIEMPGENGFQLFEHFKVIDFEVVFITAYEHYAIQAIKKAAIDYLVKPIDQQDLQDAIAIVEKKKQSRSIQQRIESLLSHVNPGPDHQKKIALPTLQGFKMEKVNHILYCEADHNYSIIHTLRGESILVSKSLATMEELLPIETFFRIHKSYLVNLNYVNSYSKADGYKVTLDNGKTLEVAFRRNDEFVKALTKRG